MNESELASVSLCCCFLSAVNSLGYQPRPMILTSGGQLPSRNIIHIVGQSNPTKIKDVVYSVLKFCEENRFSSVSFPALGTGRWRHKLSDRFLVRLESVISLTFPPSTCSFHFTESLCSHVVFDLQSDFKFLDFIRSSCCTEHIHADQRMKDTVFPRCRNTH